MRRYVLVCDDEVGCVESYRQYLAPSADGGSAIERLRRLKGASSAPARGPLPEGWELLTAGSGEQTLAIGARVKGEGGEICVAFVDVKMAPGIDGIETVLRLLKLFPRMRCGIVSAYNDRPVDQINALFDPEHQDHWDFLSKPFTESEMRQKARMLAAMWLQADAESKARTELTRVNAELAALVAERTRQLEKTQAQIAISERLVAMGTLAAGIGHEINNPLTYVFANLELVSEALSAWDGLLPAHRLSDVAGMVSQCRDGAERIRKIVRGLSSLSRQTEETREPVDIERSVERAIAMTENEIRHRARLVRRYGPMPPAAADEARLTQVFINLLMNAAQAIPEGHIEDNEICVTTRTDGEGCAQIEIRDTGSGITAADLGRIFDPFFTLKPVGVGTGLGLSISHGIVAALGGNIGVDSVVGQGTTFRVVLPPAQPAPAADARRRPDPTVRRGRVLAIDDEPAIGAVIRRALAAEHDVVVVQSGREGLSVVAGGDRFDVILCDLMMPNVTGIEVYAELSGTVPEQAERMVFVTGGAFTAAAKAFLERVPNPRLEKPFEGRLLRDLIRQLVR